MSKTTKKTKTSKKTVKTSKPRVSAKHAAPPASLFDRAQAPIEMVKDVATKGLRLGLGLGAYLFDNPQDIKLGSLRGNLRENLNSLVTTAIHKGEKIEREQRTWLSNFEREQRKRVKLFLAARKRDLERTEASLEEKIEEVIASLDIPTRNDIHQLNRRLNDLSKELARQRTRKQTPRSTAKRSKHVETASETTAA